MWKKNFYQLPTRGKKLTQSKVSNAFNNNVFVSKSKMVFERKSFFPSKRHQDISSFGFHRTLKPFFVCKLARCPFRETSSILRKLQQQPVMTNQIKRVSGLARCCPFWNLKLWIILKHAQAFKPETNWVKSFWLLISICCHTYQTSDPSFPWWLPHNLNFATRRTQLMITSSRCLIG